MTRRDEVDQAPSTPRIGDARQVDDDEAVSVAGTEAVSTESEEESEAGVPGALLCEEHSPQWTRLIWHTFFQR